jgi:hypothetical protein
MDEAMTKLKTGQRIFSSHISFSAFPADDLAGEKLVVETVVDQVTGNLVYITLRPEGSMDTLLIHFRFGRKSGESRKAAVKLLSLMAETLTHLAQQAGEGKPSLAVWPTGPTDIGCYLYKLPVVERNKPPELFVTREPTRNGTVIEWRYRPFASDYDLLVQAEPPTEPGNADRCFSRLMNLLSRLLSYLAGRLVDEK